MIQRRKDSTYQNSLSKDEIDAYHLWKKRKKEINDELRKQEERDHEKVEDEEYLGD